MRQIDADNLWKVLRGEEGAKALNHSPVKLMDVKQIIDNAPTIDAIPMWWITEKFLDVLNKDKELSKAVWLVRKAWQKEQGAQDG